MKFGCLVFAAALVGGCADVTEPNFDLGGKHDLSAGGDDLSESDDLAIGDDLAGSSDDGAIGCTKVSSWPGLAAAAGFDSSGPVTYLDSLRQSFPTDVLDVGDWHINASEVYPKTITFSSADTFTSCDVCVRVLPNCNSMLKCDPTFYFAQGGSVTVTQADQNATVGRMKLTGSNIKLYEWSFDGKGVDQLVPGGKCYEIASVSLDVPWNHTATDGGTPPVDMKLSGPPDLSPPGADMRLACAPVINELQTAGTAAMVDGSTASYEFVEIYNPCPNAVDLTGWKLGYRSAGNNSKSTNADITAFSFGAMSIPAAGYLVIGGTSYTGTKDGTLTTGLAAGGGAIGLRDAAGTLVDSVSYMTLTTANNLTEGTPAANPPAGSSLERFPNGVDTNHNNLDFKTTTTATPRAINL